MANAPAPTDAAHDDNDIPPAMDYAAHNATYNGFMKLVKWSIIILGITVVALYFFIIGQQPVVGAVLLLLIPVGAIAVMVMGSRRS
ncbi:MAG TPA: aa3-type cytochrome c oxidase subunit IV [Devosiaceae bacterium]|jgi:hypothetical protein|nr:aa3-type cytochrome c oxidase subunit IV [Devosiaceae bacterium]